MTKLVKLDGEEQVVGEVVRFQYALLDALVTLSLLSGAVGAMRLERRRPAEETNPCAILRLHILQYGGTP